VTNRSEPSAVVLVAEDDVLIRMIAVDALTEAGFAVIDVGHAEHALNVLSNQGDDVRALFTDIHMPGSMNGLELAHHVHGHWPWIVLLVASGEASLAAEELPAGSRFLRKPTTRITSFGTFVSFWTLCRLRPGSSMAWPGHGQPWDGC
jgi:CheY-like chemotaxis protein